MKDQPTWLERAWAELGQKEVQGVTSNPRIVDLFREVGHGGDARDEIAWCAAFVGACLERSGLPSTRSLRARSYLTWGEALEGPRLGAVAVLTRGPDPALGHVGFVVGESGGSLLLLGGNQSDAVTVEAFDRVRVLGYRWPAQRVDPSPQAQATRQEAVFERALAHVLQMEGGFTNDPYDPGGATNKGITIGVFAREKGVTLDASNNSTLIEELKRIPDEMVRKIYLERYWRPSHAGELSPGLALMHFDAAVNHGVGTAIRFLQQAVGADVDGEIGPQTRGAMARAPVGATIGAYAQLRRQRYRALPHFWRFGRGWLNRVDKTQARALSLLGAEPVDQSDQQQKGEANMSETTIPSTPKWWGESMTIWGTVVTALSTVLPLLGPLIGISITGEVIQQLGDHVVQVVQALGGLIGLAMTVYGRARATQPLVRRALMLKL